MSINTTALDAQIALNDSNIAAYQAALAADAANPLKTYSKDGESLDRDGWRKGIMDGIEELRNMNVELQKMRNMAAPYVVRTRHLL